MSDRTLELILKVNNQSTQAIQQLKGEIQGLLKDVQALIDRLEKARSGGGISRLNAQLGVTKEQFETLQKAAGAAQEKNKGLFDALTGGNASAFEGITRTAFAFNQVTLAVQGVIAAAKPAYDLLIQQNVDLQNQLLATQSTLAATNRVFQGGEEIKDPTKAIQALEGPVNDAIARVRKGSLELVGVTSNQLVPIFQNIAGQSASLNASLNDSAGLTLKFAAALGTLKIPLEQQRQEISSILQGQISQDSILAKSIGLNNQLVEKYRAQGTLVQFLNTRLEAFSAGNKLAAQTIDGVTSNIKEIFDEIGRQAGQPLLDPLVKALNSVFEFLQKNQTAIVAGAKTIIDTVLQASNVIGESLQPTFKAVVDIISSGAPLAQQLFIVFVQGATAAVQALAPVVNVLTTIIAKAVEGYEAIAQVILASQIADADSAIETYANTVNQLADEAIKAAQAQKALNDARAKGGQLTPEQIAKEQALKNSSKNTVAAIDEQIAALKQLSTFSPAQSNAVQGLVEQLEASKRALGSQGLAGDTKLALKEAEDLGTGIEQLTRKLEENQGAIKRSQTTEEVNKALKERIELIQKAIDLGSITPEEGQNELEKIANNSKANFDIIKAAQDSITKARKQALDQQILDDKGALAETEANAKRGVVSLEQAAKDTTAIKKRQLEAQLEDTRTQIRLEQDAIERGRGSPQKLTQLKAQEKELNAQVVNEEIAGREKIQQARERESNLRKADLDAQIKDIQASVQAGTIGQIEGAKRVTALKKQQLDQQLEDINRAIAEEEQARRRGEGSPQRAAELAAKRKALLADQKQAELDGQKQIQQAALQEVERAQSRATSIVKLAETERLQEVQKLLNEGVIRKEDAEQKKLQSARRTLEEELKVAQDGIKKLEALPKSNDPRVESDRQKLIREARQRTADITLRLLENERSQQEAVFAIVQRRLNEQALIVKNQAELEKQGYERQNQLLEAGNRILNRRSQLLEAQKNLVKAASDFQQSGFRQAIDLLQSQFDTEDKILERQKRRAELQKRIAEGDTGAAEELAALDRQEQRERQLIALKIEAKQREIESLNIQQELELRSLEIEEQKTLLLQKQEEIRARIAVTESKSQQFQAVADAAKVNANPNATAADREAARLNVQAANQRRQGAEENLQLVQQQSAANQELFAKRRETLQIQQQQQRQEKRTELQILQNQQFALSGQAVFRGTPEDRANQARVAEEDRARRESVAREEARMQGRPFIGLGGQGQGAPGSQQQLQGALDQARSPLEDISRTQLQVNTEMRDINAEARDTLIKIYNFMSQQGLSQRGGTNIINNISGQIDPNKAADEATKRTIAAMKSAFTTAGRR